MNPVFELFFSLERNFMITQIAFRFVTVALLVSSSLSFASEGDCIEERCRILESQGGAFAGKRSVN